MNNARVTTLEGIFLLVVVIVNHLVLSLPKTLIELSGSSSIINIIYICLLAFLVCFLIFKLFKSFQTSDIVDVSEFLGGKFLKTLIALLYIGYLIFISGILVRNFSEGLKLTYFTEIPVYIIYAVFILIAVIANKHSAKIPIRCNLIIMPLMILSFIITMLAVMPKFVFQRMFPILGYGLNETFFLGASNLFALSGIAYLFLINPMLEKPKNAPKIGYSAIAISGGLLLMSVASLLLALPFITSSVQELTPIYLLVRSADFGRFFQRPEAIFILIWILSLMSYLAVNIMFCINLCKKITPIKNRTTLSILIGIAIFIVAFIPKGLPEIKFLENVVYKYVALGLVFGLSPLLLLIANLKKRYKKDLPPKEGEVTHE